MGMNTKIIPKQLQKTNFGFVKLRKKSKIPIEKDWQNNPYAYKEIQSWIKQVVAIMVYLVDAIVA